MDKSLYDYGIVSGDILRILLKEACHFVSPTVEMSSSSVTSSKFSVDNALSLSDSSLLSANEQILASENIKNAVPLEVENNGSDTDEVVINKYLREPMLCSDSTSSLVPEVLWKFYSNTEIKNKNEAACIVIHVMMTETGFYSALSNSDDGVASSSDLTSFKKNPNCTLPEDWRQQGMYFFQYRHVTCPSLIAVIMCVPVSKLLTIHGSIEECENSPDLQLSLKSEDYVISSDFQKDAAEIYYNLAKLSRLFKDTIAYPLLDNMQTVAGLPPQYGLMSLLMEIKLYVLSFLGLRSLLNMSEVCKEFNILVQEPVLWKKLYFKDFKGRGHCSNTVDWYELYKKKYLEVKNQRRFLLQEFVIPPLHPRPMPRNPYFPGGIIGGEYDIMPAFVGDPNPFSPRFENVPPYNLPRPNLDPFDPNNHFEDPLNPLRPNLNPFRPGGRTNPKWYHFHPFQ